VLYKWLKDRKNRGLSDGEIKPYIKIIEAIKQSIVLQKEVDKLYPTIERDLLTISK